MRYAALVIVLLCAAGAWAQTLSGGIMAGATSGDSSGGADTTPPVAPTSLACTPGDAELACSWAHAFPADVDEYVLEYRTPIGSGLYTEVTPRPTTASDTITGLSNGSTYDVQVAAEDVANNRSGYDGPIQASPADTTPPGQPTSLNCTPGDTEFTCTWGVASGGDVAGYQGRYDCGGGFTAWGTEASPWNVTGRTNDVACDVEVRAFDEVPNYGTAATDIVTPTAVVATLYDDPTKNIFSTYDPLCDGTNPEIIFCDGFEDGTWHTFEAPGPNVQASPADDYWGHGAFLDTHLPDDQLDTDWADCRPGAIDTTKADFGAAGTRCAASMGWVQDQNSIGGSNFVGDGHHRTVIDGTNPAQSPATGPYDINVRWYFREDGTKSTRCPGGWPNCPAFSYASSTANNNGYKAVELGRSFSDTTLVGPVHGSRTKAQTASGALNLFDFGEFAGCSGSPAVDVEELQTWPAGGSPPHFDHTQNRGKWIAVQVRWRMAATGRLTLWMDDCGEDGRQCTGTPTVRIDTGTEGNIDLTPQCLPNGIREVWFNYYSGGVSSGELKIDGIVVRDNTSLDLGTRSTPIPFEPNHSGL